MTRMQLSANTEAVHQTALVTWIGHMQASKPELALLFAIPNGELRSKATAGRLKAQGVRAGVPDLFLAVARGKFHGLFIEMKRPAGADGSRAGVTSKEQREWIEALRAQGYRVEVAFGWEQATMHLLHYLALTA